MTIVIILNMNDIVIHDFMCIGCCSLLFFQSDNNLNKTTYQKVTLLSRIMIFSKIQYM